MAAKFYNLLIEQGASCEWVATVNLKINGSDTLLPRDLTGYAARAQIRKTYTASEILATFSTAILIETSQIIWSLTAAQTEAIPSNCLAYQVPANLSTLTRLPDVIGKSAYVWDLELFKTDNQIEIVERSLQGSVLVTPGVTR